MTPERENKIRTVISKRQTDLTVVMENVHDPHNIFAVLRTCDSVGIQDVYVIDTHNIFHEKTNPGKRSSASSMKWVDLHIFPDPKSCFDVVKQKYTNIYATHLSKDSISLYDLSLTESTAMVFGNEKDGLSEEVLTYCNHNFIIPQVGMIRSLNISVACAVSLYEAFRQRNEKGFYDQNNLDTESFDNLFEKLSNR